jgi:hypothetical protein
MRLSCSNSGRLARISMRRRDSASQRSWRVQGEENEEMLDSALIEFNKYPLFRSLNLTGLRPTACSCGSTLKHQPKTVIQFDVGSSKRNSSSNLSLVSAEIPCCDTSPESCTSNTLGDTKLQLRLRKYLFFTEQ